MTTVLVTRPSHQQANFLVLCKARGLNTHCLPLIRIEARTVDDALWRAQLENPDTAWIFTSRNAVEHCPFDSQPTGSVFAMGASTARALERTGRTLAVEPDVPFNSEALVAQLKHANAHSAVVVTGLGGRAYLAHELRSMQWAVTEVACYERHPVEHTKQAISEALNAADILSLTSIESMDALLSQCVDIVPDFESNPSILDSSPSATLLKQCVNIDPDFESDPLIVDNSPSATLLSQCVDIDPDWKSKPLVVNSQRAVDAAQQAGFTGIIEVAIPAGDQGQIEAIDKVLKLI